VDGLSRGLWSGAARRCVDGDRSLRATIALRRSCSARSRPSRLRRCATPRQRHHRAATPALCVLDDASNASCHPELSRGEAVLCVVGLTWRRRPPRQRGFSCDQLEDQGPLLGVRLNGRPAHAVAAACRRVGDRAEFVEGIMRGSLRQSRRRRTTLWLARPELGSQYSLLRSNGWSRRAPRRRPRRCRRCPAAGMLECEEARSPSFISRICYARWKLRNAGPFLASDALQVRRSKRRPARS